MNARIFSFLFALFATVVSSTSFAYEPGTYWGTTPLFLRDSSGYNYFHNDVLGTPQKITNKSGTVRWQAQYSGFGKATETPAGVKNPIRFPGQYFDPETGLHQNFMRDYDPAIAAYLGQDPYGILTGANRYAYAYGDPIHLSDPTGEIVPLIVAGLFVVDVAFTIYTGFEIYQCAELLNQNCFSFEDGSICQKALIDAGLAVAGYGIVKVVEKGALWGLRTIGKPLANEIGAIGSQLFKTVETRKTRNGEAGIRITDHLGNVKDITPQRVKEFIPEPRAKSGLRPKIFEDGIPGSKGKKGLPTQNELDLLNDLTR